MEKIVDLNKITQGRSRMLAGAERGLAARKLLNLDEIEIQSDKIVVKAPEKLQTIASSFVQALLGDTFNKLGDKGLQEKYDFSQLPKFLQEDFERGISRLRLHRRPQ